MTDWKSELNQSLLRYKNAHIIGAHRIQFTQHAKLITTALHAFGDDPKTTFYIEGLPPQGNIPRPDLILLHPDIGVLVIENKGVELGDIHNVDGTTLIRTLNGQLKEEDPFLQAEKVMFRLRDLCKQRFNIHNALFLRTVALPRIRRSEFELRYKHQWPRETLFDDACSDPKAFHQQVLDYANAGQRTAQKSHRLSKRAHDQIMTILNGTALFNAPRRTFIEDADPSLLGLRIQEFELASKEPTQQQKDLGRSDMRGAHRLFRGVAGSGKSIMLALSVSQSLLAFTQEQPSLFAAKPTLRRILVVCYNRTLVHYLRNKIEDRYGRIAWDIPTEEQLKVTHSESLIRNLESKHPSLDTGLTYDDRDTRAQKMAAAFDKLPPLFRDSLLYDAVYIDEAQDLRPAEFELLRRLARTDDSGNQTFIIFYDNAQNIYGVTPPTWEKLSINIKGRTTYLDTCLRNTTETLAFAFNVLVGSFAPEGQRVATKQFADVASLKQRNLISENGDRYDIKFSPRTGPQPLVKSHPFRNAEIDWLCEEIKFLTTRQRVLPSDILVLYKSHHSFKDKLTTKLQAIIGPSHKVRFVDSENNHSKNLPLMDDGILTISTIASAKGYDAPIVFLLGIDELDSDPQGRASFYVAATRAKLCLYVSGVKHSTSSPLLDEVVSAHRSLTTTPTSRATRIPPIVAKTSLAKPPVPKSPPHPPLSSNQPKYLCRSCGSTQLHAQHGRYGYFFRCIDCTENTPIDTTCPKCGEKARIRKDGLHFYLECAPSQFSQLIHTNTPLDKLES